MYFLSRFLPSQKSEDVLPLSKTHQGSLKLFLKSPRPSFLIKLAALGNLKVSFHCARLHSFFPLKSFFENPPVLPYP